MFAKGFAFTPGGIFFSGGAMKIDITFDVHGAKDVVEGRQAIIAALNGVGLFRMNEFLAAEGKKIHIAVVTPK